MRSITLTILAGLTLTSFLPLAWALDDEAQAAKDEGMRLYGIRQVDSAIPYLEQAASAGDAEAMYYLGEANRRLVMGGMNQAALDWYYQAAQHGEPYAMLRLFDGDGLSVGPGIVPMQPEQRRLGDLNGWLTQDTSAQAEQVWYVRHGLVKAI